MDEVNNQYADNSGDQYFSDINTRIRDLEERQRILKERVLIVGETLVNQRNNSFSEIQEMKKDLIKLTSETERMKELLERITTGYSQFARKEELMIIQRQLDLLRK